MAGKPFSATDITSFLTVNSAIVIVWASEYQSYELNPFFMFAGANVYIGKPLQTHEVSHLLFINRQAVTVVGTGYESYELQSLITAGARIVTAFKPLSIYYYF